MRTYGQNFSSSIDRAYINNHRKENPASPKFFPSIQRVIRTHNLKRVVFNKAILLLVTILLIAIAGFVLSNQGTSKNSINQLNTLPTAKKTAGVSITQTPAPMQHAAANTAPSAGTMPSNNSTTIDVNGQTVTVPANSNYNQTTSNASSTSSVTVSNHSSSTGSGASNNSSTSVDINSQ